MTEPKAPILEAQNVTKIYPGVTAVANVTVSVAPGEVVALVGENGAGKSTLMKLISGEVAPTSGRVERRDGARISIVHQELCLADNLTAGQNICLGDEPTRLGLIQERALHERAEKSLRRVGADFSARTPVARLSIAQRQLVEIARAIDDAADVLILDEPTSSLTAPEADRLLELVSGLKAEGCGIVYVSHRLPEILEVADRAIVLRDGRLVGEIDRAHLTRGALVERMIGRAEDAAVSRPPADTRDAEEALRCTDLCTDAWPSEPVDLSVAAGEIVGIAGLVGAGRTELLETLVGLRRARSGQVILAANENVTDESPRQRFDRGVGFVPEDRAAHGLFVGGRTDENLALPTAHRRAASVLAWTRTLLGGWIRRAAERDAYTSAAESLDVRAATPAVPVDSLSGGNQQKVLVGRWIGDGLRALLLDEPTRGVDVGAREGIYSVLEDLAGKGAAVLFASSDLEEVRRLSQRVLVMHDGRIAGELTRDQATESAIMNLCTGGAS